MILTPHLVLRNDPVFRNDPVLRNDPATPTAATLLPTSHPGMVVVLQDPDPSAAPTVSRGRTGGATGEQGTTQADPNQPDPERTGPPQGCFDQQSLIFVLLFVGVVYFMMLRPQQKQEKKLKEMRAGLQKGDRAVTSAGIHGVVDSLSEHTVTLRVDGDVRLTFDRSAIARVADDGAAATETPAKS